MQTGAAHPQSLKAGAARVDITPAPGIPLTGFIARAGPSTGIHDRLYARALVLEAGGQRVLLIACDLLALDAGFVSSARAAIRQETGISEAAILIACTHTHSGPATIFLRDCGEVSRAYLGRLRVLLVRAAREAAAGLAAVKLGAGCGEVTQGVVNRRQPGAAPDPALGVAAFQHASGRLTAILANYACHPVCLDHTNRLVSADYPGSLARALEEKTGAVVLFTNGACGDINPEPMGRLEDAARLGQALAEEALRVLADLQFQDCASLQPFSTRVNLPLNPLPSTEELSAYISEQRRLLAQAQWTGAALDAKMHTAMLGWAEAVLAEVLSGGLPGSVPAEIQVICMGSVTLVGLPGEVFNELGRQIKSTRSDRQVLVLGYANQDIGYIPTREAYALGGYEIEDAYKYYGYPAALAPAAGDMVFDAAARLIDQVQNKNC